MPARPLVFGLCVGLCAVAGIEVSYAQRAQNPLSQPFRDIGIVRDHVPPVLERAVAAPYALPGLIGNSGTSCVAIMAEISALDSELGPDVDVPPERRTARGAAGNLLAGAVRSAVALPYRGVVRRLSGAEHRDQLMQRATSAGMARRAFLKGLRETQCNAAPMQEASAQIGTLDSATTLVADAPQAVPSVESTSTRAPTEMQTVSATQAATIAATPISDTVTAAAR